MTFKPFYTVASDVSFDGAWLAIGAGSDPDDYDAGGPLLLWDVARRELHSRRTIAPGGISLEGEGLLRFSPSGHYLVVQFDTNRVMTLDRASDLRGLGNIGLSYNDSSPGAALLADENALLTSGEHGLGIAPIRGEYDVDSPAVRWLGIDVPLSKVAAVGDMVVGADSSSVRALDVTAGTLRYTSTALAGGSDSAYAISPDVTVVAGADLGWVGFVDARSGRALARHEGPRARTASIVWDASSRRVAVVRGVGRRDPGDITIFEAQAPLCRLAIQPRNRPWLMAPDLRSFAFSPDGTRAVVASSAGEVVGVEVSARPRTLYRIALVDAQTAEDAGEWLGVYWCAGEQVVAITSREIIFLDGATGAVQARLELGFVAKRNVGMKGP